MSYLANFDNKSSMKCLYCDCVKEDTEHTLFVCREWNQDRNEVEKKVEIKLTIGTGNLVDIMVESKIKWTPIEEFSENIMIAKEKDEAERL